MGINLQLIGVSALAYFCLPACLAPGGFTQRNKRCHLFCSLLLIKLSTKCPGHRLPRKKGAPEAGRHRAGFVAPVVLPQDSHSHMHNSELFVFSCVLLQRTHMHKYMQARIHSCIHVMFKSNGIDPRRETSIGRSEQTLGSQVGRRSF